MKRPQIARCRELRNRQTDAEQKLWSILRNRQCFGVKFRRQFSIGKYILDFYAPEYKLGIEADGGQHYGVKGEQYDILRAEELSRDGVTLLRFSNLDIMKNIEGVYEEIQKVIYLISNPSPLSSPRRGEESG